jgi:gamma-glutamyltranspeptidase
VIDFGMPIHQAVSVPRFSYGGPQETGSSIVPVWRVEEGILPEVISDLERMGHRIQVVTEEGGMVNGISRDPETGALQGGADPRGRSYAIGY